MTPEQEREYIQQAQKNPQAFAHLYDHYFPRIHAYVRYRVHSQQDAEVVLQNRNTLFQNRDTAAIRL